MVPLILSIPCMKYSVARFVKDTNPTILLSMRKMLPDLITVIIANELVAWACSFVMITYGIHLFYEKKFNYGVTLPH